jgi:2-desacetyl-2-hydroxyethyl bacteriochlorophyllide A dehydrogenase
MNAIRPMAFITEPRKIEFRDVPIPELGPEDVLIAVKAAAICGSDLHIFKGKHPAVDLPVPVGHEVAGLVTQVGTQVTRFEPGDRVTVEPVIACGECFFCKRGDYHLCTDISFQYRQGQGGLTTHFVANQQWVHRLPEGLTYAQGALLEPLSVAVHAVEKANLGLADSVAIFGAGAIGLLLLQLAQAAGAGEVFIVDIQPHRLEAATSLGAQVLDNSSGDVVSEIYARTEGLGVECAFEAVGLASTLKQTLSVLRKGGQAVLIGLFEESEIRLPANIFVQKEISLSGSQGYCWDFQTAVKLVTQGRLDLGKLITHQFPLAEAQAAFDALMSPQEKAMKIVIKV